MAKRIDRAARFEPEEATELHRQAGHNYLFVIGIDKYQHHGDLNNAVRDAKDFRKILLEKYQFSTEHTWSMFDEMASRKNIIDTLTELEKLVTKDDNFILYFSGHGTMNSKKTKGFWIPADAESPADYIPNSRIKDLLDDIPAHHIYLIVDSCFSGSIVHRSAEFAKRVEALPSRRVLTSGRNELVSDGRIGTNSPFANCLIKYLKIHSGLLTASDLEQHVKKNTPRSAAQTPASAYIKDLGDQGGEFVFHPKTTPKENFRESLLDLEMVFVEGGIFSMGGEQYGPVHKVEVSNFYLGRYLVTYRQFVAFLNEEKTNDLSTWTITEREGAEAFRIFFSEGSYSVESEYENYPVNFVSWHGAKEFCSWLSRKSGKEYRLPTEAEWEFAARGGNEGNGFIYSGSNLPDEVGWYRKNANRVSHPVGLKKPNELGLYDMSGNVREWCADFYDLHYYQTCKDQGTVTDPSGPNRADREGNVVFRGGCWYYNESYIEVARRFAYPLYKKGGSYLNHGFRVAMTWR